MKSVLIIVFAMAFTAILFTGCSKNSNPVGTDTGNGGGDPDPIINTPVKMHITQIRVSRFPEKKPNGDFWDYSPILPLSSRPDVFVKLSKGGTTLYRSNTEQDAYYQSSYTFTKAALLNGPDLPYDASMSASYKLEVLDDDVIADDLMATFNFTPESYYNNDNAETFGASLSVGSVDVVIYGDWIY
jgi:hypothetical protein